MKRLIYTLILVSVYAENALHNGPGLCSLGSYTALDDTTCEKITQVIKRNVALMAPFIIKGGTGRFIVPLDLIRDRHESPKSFNQEGYLLWEGRTDEENLMQFKLIPSVITEP